MKSEKLKLQESGIFKVSPLDGDSTLKLVITNGTVIKSLAVKRLNILVDTAATNSGTPARFMAENVLKEHPLDLCLTYFYADKRRDLV